jgi:hypothetical protein
MAAGVMAGGLAVLAGSTMSPPVHAQGDAIRPAVRELSGAPGTLQADVTLRHERLSTDARAGRTTLPPVTWRLDRQLRDGRWLTTLSFRDGARPTARAAGALLPLDNPFLISRLEFDDDGAEPRLYDGSGRRVTLPSENERRRLGVTPDQRGVGWDPRIWARTESRSAGRVPGLGAAQVLAEAGGRDQRRGDLQRRFGRAVGRIRGFDRFVTVDGPDTHEILVNPEAALPVEVNTVRDDALVARAELRYAPVATVGHLRQFLRTEQRLTDRGQDRVITEIELSNVAVATGARP